MRTKVPAAANVGGDTEALIRQVVAKVQNQGNAEVERLRAAVRKAITALPVVVAE